MKREFYDASQLWLGQMQVTNPFRQVDWRPITATAASGTAYIRVLVIATAIAGTAWFDDVSLDDGIGMSMPVVSYSALDRNPEHYA